MMSNIDSSKYNRIKKGLRYAKWPFIISFVLILFPLLSAATGMAAVAFSIKNIFNVASVFVPIPFGIALPFFLLGYLRTPKQK